MLQVQSFGPGFQIMKVPGAPFIDKKFYPHTRTASPLALSLSFFFSWWLVVVVFTLSLAQVI